MDGEATGLLGSQAKKMQNPYWTLKEGHKGNLYTHCFHLH